MRVRDGKTFIRKEEKRMIHLIKGRKKLDIQQIAVFLFMSGKHILDQRQHLETCMCR